MKRFLLSTFLLVVTAFAISLDAQSIKDEIYACPEKSGNNYYNYHYTPQRYTPAPRGYKPFYISHYGRHGSRWMVSDSYYDEIKAAFDKAAEEGILTPLGKDVYERVKIAYDDGVWCYGALSPLGAEQHREIAERMYGSFPEIFRRGAKIEAVSTVVPRCILSMSYFCERLKELEPGLSITKEATPRTTRYLNCFEKTVHPELSKDFHAYRGSSASWRKEYKAAAKEYVAVDSVTGRLFTDPDYKNRFDAVSFVIKLFLLASDMQDLDLGISFYDVFTIDELYKLNLYENYRYYVLSGPSSINKRFPEYYGRVLLEEIISKADRAIEEGAPCADLRFGHDSNVVPLITMLQFTEYSGYDRDERDMEAVANTWSMFKLSPMAANVQIILYRKGKTCGPDDILVRMMHNEMEMHLPLEAVSGPYYRWSDVRKFYVDYINSLVDPTGN